MTGHEYSAGDVVTWRIRSLMGGFRVVTGTVQEAGLERYGHDDVMTVMTKSGELAEIRAHEARLVRRGRGDGGEAR